MKATKLNFWSSTAIVIGSVIGAGVFVKPGRVLTLSGNTTIAMLAWIIGGIITLAGGLTVAEIASRIPRAGGVYAFIEEIYGKKMAFVVGWMQSVIYGPGIISALCIFFGALFCTFFDISMEYQKTVALSVIGVITAINILGTRYASWIQNSTVLVKLFPLILIGAAGVFFGKEPVWNIDLPGNEITLSAGLAGALLSTLWAYDGWLGVAAIAGEIENPAKNMPKAIIFGLSIVMLTYVLINFSIFHILDKTQIASLGEHASGAAAMAIFGPVAGKVLSFCIMISILGGLNGQIMTQTRVPYAMANASTYPLQKYLAKVNPNTQTPVNSIIYMIAISVLIILTLHPDRITDLSIFSMYSFYGLVCAGIFKVRKMFGVPERGQYKVPFYPVIPVVAILGVLYICYGMLQQSPMDAMASMLITASGLPLYLFLTRKS